MTSTYHFEKTVPYTDASRSEISFVSERVALVPEPSFWNFACLAVTSVSLVATFLFLLFVDLGDFQALAHVAGPMVCFGCLNVAFTPASPRSKLLLRSQLAVSFSWLVIQLITLQTI